MNLQLIPLFIWYDDSDNLIVVAPAGTGVAPTVDITIGDIINVTFYIDQSKPEILYIDQSLSPAFYIDQARNVDMER